MDEYFVASHNVLNKRERCFADLSERAAHDERVIEKSGFAVAGADIGNDENHAELGAHFLLFPAETAQPLGTCSFQKS